MRPILALALLVAAPAFADGVPAPAVLSGTVLASSGGPLAGVSAELSPVESRHEEGLRLLSSRPPQAPDGQVKTGETGRFDIAVPSGLYRLALTASGRVPVERTPVPLAEDAELEPVSLAPDVGLRVRVIDAGGRGVADALVIAGAAPLPGGWNTPMRLARTGPDGRARLARREGEALDLSLFVPGYPEIRRQSAAADLTIVLQPAERGREVSLQALGGDGLGVPQALVRCAETGWPAAVTDSGGRAVWRARARERTSCELSTADGRKTAFAVEADAPAAEVRLAAEPPVLAGRVQDAETGAPLASALIWPPADPGLGVRSGLDGGYRLTAPDTAAFGLRTTAAGYLAGGTRVARPEIRTRRLPALALRRAATLDGIVQDAAGTPLADVLVEAVAGGAEVRDGRVADRRRTRRDGRFTLRRLAGGRFYEIRAARHGFLAASAEVALPSHPRPLPPLRLLLAPNRPARGQVVDEAGRPLAGARVVLRKASGTARSGRTPLALPPPGERGTVEALSDARGRFAFPQVPAAGIDLLAAREGFAPLLSRNHQVPPGNGTWDLGRVVLRRGMAVSGQVIDPAGRPIAGARVHRVADRAAPEVLARALRDEQPDATTGADGRFTLTDLPAGKPVHLFVAASRFLPGGAQGVKLPLRAPLTIRLTPGARLAGRILDETGAPVAEANVRLARRPAVEGIPVGQATYREASSDQEGRFEIADAPAGDARLTVDARGFVPWTDDSIAVPPPEGLELEVRLTRGAVLAGSVRTTGGEPVAGAQIMAGPATTRTDAEGLYRLEGVETGAVEVELFHPNHARKRHSMTIEPGTNTLDFELSAGRRVAGRVSDEDGGAVAAAELVLESPGWGFDHRTYRARSAADGLFEFTDVPAGSYRLEAAARGFAPQRRKEVVQVAEADLEDVEVKLGAAGAVAGRVLGLDEEQLSRVDVRAEDEEEMDLTRQGRVGADGRFEVRDLAPGVWELHASLASELREVTARVVIAPGDTAQRDLEFDDRLSLSGRVEYDGEPLPEARVSLRAGGQTLERSVLTGYDGSFRLADLEPDTYWLGVSSTREALIYNDVMELTADREVVIRLEAGAFRALVRDAESGKPLAAATAQLFPAAGADFTVAGATGEDGRVLLPRVPPGTLRLRVGAEGYKAEERTVEILQGPAGAAAEIQVELTPAAGLQLAVHLASGAVPAEVEIRVEGAPSAERRPVAPDGSVRLPSLPAGTWSLVVTAPGGSPVRIAATVPGPDVAVVLPEAAPLQVEIPELLESNLIGSLRLADAAGHPLEVVSPAGQLASQTALVAGRALVPAVPAGAWSLQAETPDGRRWSAAVTTDGRNAVVLRLE